MSGADTADADDDDVGGTGDSGPYRLTVNTDDYVQAEGYGAFNDPRSDETHKVEDDAVVVPDLVSAAILVEKKDALEFDEGGPSEETIEAAMLAEYPFIESDLAMHFLAAMGKRPEEIKLDKSKGFDPAEDSPNNSEKLRLMRAYEKLVDEGRDVEAEFFRQLTKRHVQDSFRKYLRMQRRGSEVKRTPHETDGFRR